ncbi:MAG TPA: D-alanine--D-alanine ligase [Bacillota bacterium]|nr:D-alanine--D-alanine ligase [Bacillota bacterium]
MAQKIRVGLIFGGRSGEHEVSVLSAKSVMEAMDPAKYEVFPIGITKKGEWLPGISPLRLAAEQKLEVLPGETEPRSTEMLTLENTKGQILGGLSRNLDVIFPILHGPYGEDGTMQGLLELAGIPYIGGGVLASALGMDKALMKVVFQQEGLPIGDYLAVLRHDWEKTPDTILADVEEKIGYPCFIKPANLGSSVGISKAHNRDELKKALDHASAFDRRIVVEAFIDGREVECSVLGNDDPIASVPGEVVPCAEFYDYEAKYVLNDSKLIIPANLPKETAETVRALAVRAFKSVDCAGMARVDFFVTHRDGRVIINEINTLPGFTRISMYPKLWEASGIGYAELIDRLIQLAIERYQDRQRNRVS